MKQRVIPKWTIRVMALAALMLFTSPALSETILDPLTDPMITPAHLDVMYETPTGIIIYIEVPEGYSILEMQNIVNALPQEYKAEGVIKDNGAAVCIIINQIHNEGDKFNRLILGPLIEPPQGSTR